MMKSMEEYINEVYQKYEESERNHEVYKTVKVKYHSPLTTLCSVTACLLLVCVCVLGVNKFTKEPEQNYVSNEVNPEISNEGNYIYNDIVFVDSKLNLSRLATISDSIVVISDFEITDYNYEFKNGKLLLKTIRDAKMNKILKGDDNTEDTFIKYSKVCGTISLLKLQEKMGTDYEKWEQAFIGYKMSDAEKTSSYFKQVQTKGVEFEKNKQYLVFSEYNEEKDIYEITDLAYGIMEYDPVTNMVKNIDTGEFEEFDWNLITQE